MGLRSDLVTAIFTESILGTDGGLCSRALGDEGGDVALPADNDAALRVLASEHRLRRESGVAVAAGALPLLPTSHSCSERGICTRTRGRGHPRPRAGVDAGVAAVTLSALGFGARALILSLSLLLVFGPSASTP
jgi:hypothetical protein